MFSKAAAYLEGCVAFSAEDGFTELFLEECMDSGAVLRDVSISERRVSAKVKEKNFYIIERAAYAAGMKINVYKKYGVKELVHRVKLRIGVPIGLLLGVFLFQILSSVLWSVDITGLQEVNAEKFSAYLTSYNIKTGVFITGIDCNEIESIAEKFDDRILRVSANIVGCKLFVAVKEREKPPEIKENNAYCDLNAKKDGEIVKADIFAGDKQVDVGDAVLKGDLLASGRLMLSDGEVRLVESDGVVIARTHTLLQFYAANTVNAEKIASIKDRWSISVFGLTVPPANEDSFCNSRYVCTATTVMPLGLLRYRITEKKLHSFNLSAERAWLLCLNDLAQAVYRNCRECEIAEVDIQTLSDVRNTVQADLVCFEDIAEKRFFETLEK